MSNAAIASVGSLSIPTDIISNLTNLYDYATTHGFGEKDGSAILEVLLEPEFDKNDPILLELCKVLKR